MFKFLFDDPYRPYATSQMRSSVIIDDSDFLCRLEKLLSNCSYMDWDFCVGRDESRYYLQLQFAGVCVVRRAKFSNALSVVSGSLVSI